MLKRELRGSLYNNNIRGIIFRAFALGIGIQGSILSLYILFPYSR